jgi:FkbM family methyltransferase
MNIMNVMRDAITDVRTIAKGQGAGLRISARHADPHFALGTYEPALQDAIAANLKPGDVFYDIGANIGFFSLIAARRVGPSGQVYAFEPVPANAAAIERSAHLNGFAQIDVFGEAVGARSRRGELCLAHHIGGATLDSVGVPPDFRGRIEVDIVSIDEVRAPRGLRPANLVKIDVEGAELQALEGMTAMLREDRPLIIYEVDDETRAGMQQKLDAIAAFLQTFSYVSQSMPAAYLDTSWHVAHVVARPR